MLDLISFHSGGAGWWGSWGSELLSSVRDKVGMMSSFDDVFCKSSSSAGLSVFDIASNENSNVMTQSLLLRFS